MHLSISPTKGSTTFSPLAQAYDRTTKDGLIPVFNFLLGSQYNIPIGGEISITSTGNIQLDSIKAVSGKLEIVLDSVDGTTVEKIGTFTSFMYFFPGIKILGQLEVQDDNVGSGPVPIQNIRYRFQDLSTNDFIDIIFEGHDGNARIRLEENVNGITTNLVTQAITAGVKNILFELDFLEDGITKFFFKEPSGDKTRIFNGTLKADIGEAKVVCKATLNQQTTKTLKSDLVWILYPNIFIGYDIPNLADKTKGRIRTFDTVNESLESKWVEVFSSDHTFVGERVIENGLIRIRFKPAPKMEFYGWNTTSAVWELAGNVIPISSQGDLSTTLQDIIFQVFNDAECKVVAKYGIVDHVIDIKRGTPSVHIATNSTEFRINTDKRRTALSTVVSTDIPDFNQVNTDDTNRGNPLNLSPTNNPFIFTNDSDVNTGLLLIDDNWYAWYDENDSNNMVGWMSNLERPTTMQISAVSATELENFDWGYPNNAVVSVGILEGDPTTVVGGIPKPFSIGNIDEYVKWRATEGLLGFNQRPFLRKKR